MRDDPVVSLVANANLVCHRLAIEELDGAAQTLDCETLEFLGIAPGDIHEILASILVKHQEEPA